MRLFVVAAILFLSSCGDSANEENQRLLKAYPLLGSRVPDRLLDEVRHLQGDCVEEGTGEKFTFSNDLQWVWHLFSRRSGQPEHVRSLYHTFTWEHPDGAGSADWSPPPNICEVSLRLDVVDQDEVDARCERWVKSNSAGSNAPTAAQQKFNATCTIKVTKRLDCFPEDHFDDASPYSKQWRKDHALESCSAPERDDYKVQVKRRWQELIDLHNLKKDKS